VHIWHGCNSPEKSKEIQYESRPVLRQRKKTPKSKNKRKKKRNAFAKCPWCFLDKLIAVRGAWIALHSSPAGRWLRLAGRLDAIWSRVCNFFSAFWNLT